MPAEMGPNVLVVEDHSPTARIISNTLREVDESISTEIVQDGSDCLAVLDGIDPSAARPDIVLLDLNLLDVNGFDVLEQRAGQSSSGDPPVIVVSGEDNSETIVHCYDLGANTYFEKPDDLDGFLALAECIVDHWLVKAELPSRHLDN